MPRKPTKVNFLKFTMGIFTGFLGLGCHLFLCKAIGFLTLFVKRKEFKNMYF